MSSTRSLIAFDLGASSGRAMFASFDGNALTLSEGHRFPNEPVQMLDTLYWDTPRLFLEMQTALSKASKQGFRPDAIGIDTWGVDFGLLDKQGTLLGFPVHYRDTRTEGVQARAFDRMSKADIFVETGLAFQPFNTLYQLLAMRSTAAFEQAKTLLMMPDLFRYLFTGEQSSEYTIASTSQLINPQTRQWSTRILDTFELPHSLFPPLCNPGTVQGTLLSSYGLGKVPFVATAEHDTAAAVAAVPAEGAYFAYISSGTWSLMGAELPSPILTPAVLSAGMTNEGGICGTTRFLKNIMGLWILQECRRLWASQGACEDFVGLVQLAELAPPFACFFSPDDPRFLSPGDMPARIAAYCRETGQTPPVERGTIVRAIFENLALEYRLTLSHMVKVLGHAVDALHIVGGGSNNALLNQMTASATGLPVWAGPAEATAIGNCLGQLLALGEAGTLSDVRAIARASARPRLFTATDKAAWDDAYGRFLEKTGRTA